MRRNLTVTAALVTALSFAPIQSGAAPAPPPPPPPAAPTHGFVPAWFWAGFACPASIILSGIVADFRDNRQLTYWEAWTCGLLYWIPMPYQPQTPPRHR